MAEASFPPPVHSNYWGGKNNECLQLNVSLVAYEHQKHLCVQFNPTNVTNVLACWWFKTMPCWNSPTNFCKKKQFCKNNICLQFTMPCSLGVVPGTGVLRNTWLWNSVLQRLREADQASFKRHLKSHLISLTFNWFHNFVLLVVCTFVQLHTCPCSYKSSLSLLSPVFLLFHLKHVVTNVLKRCCRVRI